VIESQTMAEVRKMLLNEYEIIFVDFKLYVYVSNV